MSETEDNPPTLASLRTRKAKPRPTRRSVLPSTPSSLAQSGFFFTSTKPDTPPTRPAPALGTSPAPQTLQPIRPNPVASAARVTTERRIWGVRALVSEIRQQVEGLYTDLWVEGEISNCRPASSGHIYFTLKDGEAQLPVVLFRRQAQLLRFRPADGLAVLVRGRISIYESRGQLQLIAETMEPRGAGALQLAFEQLKARLLAEGLFDPGRKRPLPAYPKCIGIVTSPTGAVIRDIMTVVRRRHSRLNLLVYPAIMQGASSAGSIAAGIRWFNSNPGRADMIILARGGGSMEDLACFNDEALARTIAASALPIVSAIGHETDFTIADFVADLRAPTPSAAAELVTAAQHRIEERVQALEARVHRASRFHLMHARQRYARLSAESVLIRLRDGVSRRDQRLDELRLRLEAAAIRRLGMRSQHISVLTERLRRQDVALRIAATHRRLQTSAQRLQSTATRAVVTSQSRLSRAAARLDALSPLAVLARGYALVYLQDGAGSRTLLRSAAEVTPGALVHARLAHGTVEAKVTQSNPNSAASEANAATENRTT